MRAVAPLVATFRRVAVAVPLGVLVTTDQVPMASGGCTRVVSHSWPPSLHRLGRCPHPTWYAIRNDVHYVELPELSLPPQHHPTCRIYRRRW
jgi:hypothetical protein